MVKEAYGSKVSCQITSKGSVQPEKCAIARTLISPICQYTLGTVSDSPASQLRWGSPRNTNDSNEEEEALRSSSNRFPSVQAVIQCPDAHFTFQFLACDSGVRCWAGGPESCKAPVSPLPPTFTCHSQQRVSYTLVCDFRTDCSDGSDEDFCVFPPCDPKTQFDCGNKQVLKYAIGAVWSESVCLSVSFCVCL